MNEEQAVTWLFEEVLRVVKLPADMGRLEKEVDRASQEVRRRVLERLVGLCAAQHGQTCPTCQSEVLVEAKGRSRQVRTSFGVIEYSRNYAFCSKCKQYLYPSDVALGLQPRATASPRVQEICALTALRAPSGQAQDDVRRLTGIQMDSSTLHREACRQGQRALTRRDADERLTQSLEGVAELAQRAIGLPATFTLVIQIDTWNIRERDNWGDTQALLAAGKDTNRWHWVYTGTVFRLDQRGKTAGGRSVITERGFVATRRGVPSFQRQLYAEALQRGLLKAESVLILADGAIWIWNLANDRFKDARQRIDLHHVQQHLWTLAYELYGDGSEAARQWVRPFLHDLEHQPDGAVKLIHGLEELSVTLRKLTEDQRKAIDSQIHYFREHQNRMDYFDGKKRAEPVGSGAVESTCSQYQRRFKLTGQFWSLAGDEAFLALATLHRNGRWHQLFPHDQGDAPYSTGSVHRPTAVRSSDPAESPPTKSTLKSSGS
jgi:hypothetical protein